MAGGQLTLLCQAFRGWPSSGSPIIWAGGLSPFHLRQPPHQREGDSIQGQHSLRPRLRLLGGGGKPGSGTWMCARCPEEGGVCKPFALTGGAGGGPLLRDLPTQTAPTLSGGGHKRLSLLVPAHFFSASYDQLCLPYLI